jgi:hypothetical protein
VSENINNSDKPSRLLFWCKAVLASGFAAGLFDAAYFFSKAFLNGQPPLKPLHSIAAFWLGNAAFSNGASSAVLGVFTHFGLATIMAGGYAMIALAFSFVRKRPFLFGSAYGVVLYFMMYYGIMAIRWPTLFPRFTGWNTMLTIFVHIIFGLIIALTISALDRRNQQK